MLVLSVTPFLIVKIVIVYMKIYSFVGDFIRTRQKIQGLFHFFFLEIYFFYFLCCAFFLNLPING